MSYVLTTKDNLFLDVCSIDAVVLIWAKQESNAVCVKYDDVGICAGQVNLTETYRLGKVVMM